MIIFIRIIKKKNYLIIINQIHKTSAPKSRSGPSGGGAGISNRTPSSGGISNRTPVNNHLLEELDEMKSIVDGYSKILKFLF